MTGHTRIWPDNHIIIYIQFGWTLSVDWSLFRILYKTPQSCFDFYEGENNRHNVIFYVQSNGNNNCSSTFVSIACIQTKLSNFVDIKH